MKILFLTDRDRFWWHFTPVIAELVQRGHYGAAAMAPANAYANAPASVEALNAAGASSVQVWEKGHGDMMAWTRKLPLDPGWDVVVVCAEHLAPMRWIKPLYAERGWPQKVIGMQHGVYQQVYPQLHEYADVMMAWGDCGRDLLYPAHEQGVRVVKTGTPRFDRFTPEQAVDDGFDLALAGHTDAMGGEITPWYVRHVLEVFRPTSRPLVIKVHPNDRAYQPPDDTEGIRWISHDRPPWDAMRRCSRCYLSYPSSQWLEVTGYGKPCLLGPWARNVFDRYHRSKILRAEGAVERIINVIEETANG